MLFTLRGRRIFNRAIRSAEILQVGLSQADNESGTNSRVAKMTASPPNDLLSRSKSDFARRAANKHNSRSTVIHRLRQTPIMLAFGSSSKTIWEANCISRLSGHLAVFVSLAVAH